MGRGQTGIGWLPVLMCAVITLSIAAAAIFGVYFYGIYSTRIAVIRIEGSIDEFYKYTELADTARRDPSIKAVVVVVDSPGGTVQACFQTEAALSELNFEKPVVVTMGQQATSGAYLVSTASDYIFAYNYTITGGLGVIAVWVSYENKFEREGIKYYVWRSGESKDLGAQYRAPTKEENRYMQELVDNIMSDLITAIVINRPKLENTIEGLRRGTAIYGSEAFQSRLVDAIGDYNDALRKAASLANLKEGEYTIVELS